MMISPKGNMAVHAPVGTGPNAPPLTLSDLYTLPMSTKKDDNYIVGVATTGAFCRASMRHEVRI